MSFKYIYPCEFQFIFENNFCVSCDQVGTSMKKPVAKHHMQVYSIFKSWGILCVCVATSVAPCTQVCMYSTYVTNVLTPEGIRWTQLFPWDVWWQRVWISWPQPEIQSRVGIHSCDFAEILEIFAEYYSHHIFAMDFPTYNRFLWPRSGSEPLLKPQKRFVEALWRRKPQKPLGKFFCGVKKGFLCSG